MGRPRLARDIERIIIERYRRESCHKIGKAINLAPSSVHKVLLRNGVKLRTSDCTGTRCVDCEKPTNRRRCPYHTKIRNRQLQREWWRAKNGWKEKA